MLWSRREWGRWCAVAALSVGARPMSAQTPVAVARSAVSRLVVAVEDRSAFDCLPLTIAERMGYFSAEGIALDVKEFPDEGGALAAVQGGSAHLFSGSFATLLVQPAQGAYLASLLLQGLAPQQLPQPLPTQVALLDLNAPEAIVAWMLAQGERLQYVPPKTP